MLLPCSKRCHIFARTARLAHASCGARRLQRWRSSAQHRPASEPCSKQRARPERAAALTRCKARGESELPRFLYRCADLRHVQLYSRGTKSIYIYFLYPRLYNCTSLNDRIWIFWTDLAKGAKVAYLGITSRRDISGCPHTIVLRSWEVKAVK